MKSVDELVKIFQENGFRITPQRRAIFQYLNEAHNHPTADEIYQYLLAKMPDISQATVYNTIRELLTLGELSEVSDVKESGKRFDTNTDLHHHLYCKSCHALADIELDVDPIALPAEASAGFIVEKKQVTFIGVCDKCQTI